jgi:hypothetical protein
MATEHARSPANVDQLELILPYRGSVAMVYDSTHPS